MHSDGEGETHVHPAGVAFDRGIKVFFYLGKGDYLIELAFDFATGHAQDGAVQVDVLPSGQFRVKACTYLQEAGYPALDGHTTG